MQKLGKPVDSSILDISPIAQSDLSKELNTVQNQLESRHEHNLETANKERNRLKNKLVSVTSENTKFLLELASLKEQEIEKLKEYKATLINSAVTGKIKVS